MLLMKWFLAIIGTFCMASLPAAADTPPSMTLNAVYIGASQEVKCGGTDDTVLLSSILAGFQSGAISRVRLHGRCVSTTALVARITGISTSIEGDGPDVTTITFRNATDGFEIILEKSGSACGGFNISGLSIIRGASGPVSANTALNVAVNPLSAGGCNSNNTIDHVNIRGNIENTTFWLQNAYISGVSYVIQNSQILGLLTSGTDLGDNSITFNGPNTNHYQTGSVVANSFIGGGSTGIRVTGYAQGVLISNTSVLGQYCSVCWSGVTPASNNTTYGKASPRGSQTLFFRPGTVSGITNGMIVNGTNITANGSVLSVDNSVGRVVISSPGTTGIVATGTRVSFQVVETPEALQIVNSSFSGARYDVYQSFGSANSITTSNFLRFGTGVPATWTAIDLEDNNNSTVFGNPFILGRFRGDETGIEIDNTTSSGKNNSNTVYGNICNFLDHSCIRLSGTTSRTTVFGNTCDSCLTVLHNANPAGNPNLLNTTQGVADLSLNAAAGQLITPWGLSVAYTQNSTASTVANIVSVFGMCNAANKGKHGLVSDASGTPVFWGTPSGGGSLAAPVFCNGSTWVYGG